MSAEPTSNIVNIAGASTRDRLRAEAAAKYAPEEFTPPDSDVPVLLRRLKALEQDELYTFLRDNINISQMRYDAKRASLGLVDPVFTLDEAMQMDPEWLRAISQRIEEKTNPVKEDGAETKGDGADAAPFFVPSSATTDSPTSSTKPSRKSAP